MYGSLCKCTRPAGICPRALLAAAAVAVEEEADGTTEAAVVGQLEVGVTVSC